MKGDKHNLKCALLAFLFAGFVAFTFTGGFAQSSLLNCECPAQPVHAQPAR